MRLRNTLKGITSGIFILGCAVLVSGCTRIVPSATPTPTLLNNNITASPIATSTATPQPTPFTAQFEISTKGTKRIFTEPKYHHQSTDVFIQNPDPSIVVVNTVGTTWNEFFSTLPFSLTKDCLVTGTQQTFCTSQAGTLRFLLNGQDAPDSLDLPIQPNDILIVRYE